MRISDWSSDVCSSDLAPFPTTRRIINVIGDGIDNFGGDAFIDRDLALAQDITINGLVHARGSAIPVVVRFFEAQVIGGPYAFVIPVPTPESFAADRKSTRLNSSH